MKKQYTIITESELRLALKAKRTRDGLKLRAAASAIGLASASTLHRIEHGGRFDYPTAVKILNWLQPATATLGTAEAVEAVIYADTNLSETARQKLAEMFAELYAAMRKR